MDLPKRYNPQNSEFKWQTYWREKEVYKFRPRSDSKVYTVDTPPPTVSGRMHLGHAMSYSQQDFIVRFQRMRGKAVFYPFGTDDNGLPTEKLVEKSKKIRAKDYDRAEFRKICFDHVKESQPEFISDWVRLGMSCDFSKVYSTIDSHCQKTAQKSFIELYKKGLIYRKETPVSWCPVCQTAIAQAEFENVEMSSVFNDIIFKCGGKELIIATTRPELLPACVAICYHPSDKRYEKLKGKFATVPLFDYEVPIIPDETVDPEKGTGLMMVCTFGDKEDVEKWHKYNLPLKIIFTDDGRLNELAGKYTGLSIKEARKKMIQDLEDEGLLLNQKPITHAVNVHDKCGTEVEYLKKSQWFVNVLDKKESLLEAAEKIKWHPEHMKVRYVHWVQNLNWDWCISRQRFYGVPFPVWYDKEGNVVLAEEEQLPVDPICDKPKNCDKELTPELDVMDTWMTSSLSPQIVLDWAGDSGWSVMDYYPMSLRPQAHDIIRTWTFYTIVKGLYHQGEIPWTNIMISGHVLDPKGNKMSKSKGNVINPQDVWEKYSADALRYWASGVKIGDDVPYMEKDLVTGHKTITKLWNAARFVIMNLKDYSGYDGKLEVMDKWVLSKLQRTINEATLAFESYEYSKARKAIDLFFWNIFCDQYLEIIKWRLYSDDMPEARGSAQKTIYTVLNAVIKMFAPIMPHITEEIYQMFYADRENKESVHMSNWPAYEKELIDDDAERIGDEVSSIIGVVRKTKTANGVSLGASFKRLVVRSENNLALVENDILGVTKAESLTHEKGAFEVRVEGMNPK